MPSATLPHHHEQKPSGTSSSSLSETTPLLVASTLLPPLQQYRNNQNNDNGPHNGNKLNGHNNNNNNNNNNININSNAATKGPHLIANGGDGHHHPAYAQVDHVDDGGGGLGEPQRRKTRRAKLAKSNNTAPTTTAAGQLVEKILYALIYAAVNVITAVPALYGYAAVIFNHPIYQPHRNALAKLVLFSSLIHQFGFVVFSSLSGFAIGTVQDAGLIFLSNMANTIANRMILQGTTDEKAILSTTLVLLSSGTALLGFCLIVIGKLKLANVVSYLPMPVVGGYLAFIGYFCLQAGIALAISTPLVTFADWIQVFEGHNPILALPALISGYILTLASRYANSFSDNSHSSNHKNKKSSSDTNGSSSAAGILPMCMIAIPTLFYIVVYIHYRITQATNDEFEDLEGGNSSTTTTTTSAWAFLDGAREQGWVGPVAPPTPVSDLWELVDWSLVEWKLVGKILWTWVGMVFVVSFASCLDVAAISMDMGQALDTNRELSTVGLCNFMSGLTLGFTGSYIFSQTIFTYRTGLHTRWIGIFIMVMYLYFVLSPMNLLQISPLFFLGSTLIFIGYDLMYEWLYEIRQRVLWSEYATIWGTFIAIQVVGVDAGILIGVLSAIVEHAVSNAQTTTVMFVHKRSKAVWTKEEYQYLHEKVYHVKAPKIVTLELMGPIFFGSSLSVIEQLRHEVSLPKTAGQDDSNSTITEVQSTPPLAAIQNSPRTSSYFLTMDKRPSFFRQDVTTIATGPRSSSSAETFVRPRPPQFCVLDLTQVSNVDASSARSCFLQFCRMCNKHGITVCAAGATPRIVWMLRTHDVAYPLGEEQEYIKARLQAMEREGIPHDKDDDDRNKYIQMDTDRILLFHTTHEALEFCEASLIHRFHQNNLNSSNSSRTTTSTFSSLRQLSLIGTDSKLSTILARFLGGGLVTIGLSHEEIEKVLQRLDSQRYHSELSYLTGEKIMAQDTRPQSFYVVLEGAVASGKTSSLSVSRHREPIVSGAGRVDLTQSSSFSNFLDTFGAGGGSDDQHDVTSTDVSNSSRRTDGQSERSYPPPVVGTVWPVGGVFGYTDFLLDRPRTFGAFATQTPTRVARITRSNLNLLQQDGDAELTGLLHQVLLQASVLDLANANCHRG